MILAADTLATELGTMWLVTDGESLRALDFEDDLVRLEERLRRRLGDVTIRREDDPLGIRSRLSAYFAGDSTALDAIPVNPGGTPFQRRVWNALCEIPPGTTETYGALAARIGSPTASRAVGMANSRNPIAIVIPCHRVVGGRNSLGGYAGGLDRKRRLLELEGVQVDERTSIGPRAARIATAGRPAR